MNSYNNKNHNNNNVNNNYNKTNSTLSGFDLIVISLVLFSINYNIIMLTVGFLFIWDSQRF